MKLQPRKSAYHQAVHLKESRVVFKTAKLDNLDYSLAELLNSGEVFKEKTPYYIPLIFSTLDAMYKEMKSVSAKVDSFNNFKDEITEKVAGLETKMDGLCDQINKINNEVKTIKDENSALKDANSDLRKTVSLL